MSECKIYNYTDLKYIVGFESLRGSNLDNINITLFFLLLSLLLINLKFINLKSMRRQKNN